jgi:rare lipoprotein A
VYDRRALTAAHRSLPLSTMVRVTNLANGRSVVLRVNDRGPFAGNRVLDVSQAGADLLGFTRRGIVNARVTVITNDEVQAVAANALAGFGAPPVVTPVPVASDASGRADWSYVSLRER